MHSFVFLYIPADLISHLLFVNVLLTSASSIFHLNRYETSTPGGDTTHRDQDFGYEIIDESSSHMISGGPQHVQQIPAQFREDILDEASPQSTGAQEEDSLAEQYRGTPPLKSKKKKPDRRSHEISDHVSRNFFMFTAQDDKNLTINPTLA